MLKDITIGQYFPGKSAIHKLDPRIKIVLTMAYIVMLFLARDVAGLAVGVLFLCLIYGISKVPPKMILKSLKPVVPIIIFTAVLGVAVAAYVLHGFATLDPALTDRLYTPSARQEQK